MRADRNYGRTFIRAWREYRGYSLRQLSADLDLKGAADTISHVSLNRIEKGIQPYSQPIIEALAATLKCSVSDLLERPPEMEKSQAGVESAKIALTVAVQRALRAGLDGREVSHLVMDVVLDAASDRLERHLGFAGSPDGRESAPGESSEQKRSPAPDRIRGSRTT